MFAESGKNALYLIPTGRSKSATTKKTLPFSWLKLWRFRLLGFSEPILLNYKIQENSFANILIIECIIIALQDFDNLINHAFATATTLLFVRKRKSKSVKICQSILLSKI